MLTRPQKTKRTENRSKTQSSGAENSKPRRHSQPQPPIKSTGLDSFPFAPGRQKEVIKKQNQARELLHYEQT